MTIPYEHHIFVCTNRRPDGHSRGSCAARGSEAVRDALKAKAKEAGLSNVRVNASGCLDFCERGPVVCDYPANMWWSRVSLDDVQDLVAGPLSNAPGCEALRLTESELRRGKPV